MCAVYLRLPATVSFSFLEWITHWTVSFLWQITVIAAMFCNSWSLWIWSSHTAESYPCVHVMWWKYELPVQLLDCQAIQAPLLIRSAYDIPLLHVFSCSYQTLFIGFTQCSLITKSSLIWIPVMFIFSAYYDEDVLCHYMRGSSYKAIPVWMRQLGLRPGCNWGAKVPWTLPAQLTGPQTDLTQTLTYFD